MRFVPIHCIREGMILGSNLYNERGDLMLSQGEKITTEYLKSISRLQYNGIYISDNISEDIEVINVINDNVRIKTVKAIKDAFIRSEKNGFIEGKDIDQARSQIEVIVDEIFSQSDLMVNMIDIKVFDDYTYHHSVNVAVLSIVLGVALELNRKELCDLGFAALFHDIGKVFIDKDLLAKAGRLTDAEFNEIKKHSRLGYEHITEKYHFFGPSCLGILDHHEKYGGGGYPNKLRGEKISYNGRIIAIADVYDALVSDRPYRKAVAPSDAMEYIMGSTETHFDPEMVEVFVKKIAPYPVGTCVELSNGLTGIILENYEELSMRPKIRIFKKYDKEIEPYELHLADDKSLNVIIKAIV
jgi:HD-GYP domain-containing protein (c-di-GMP phosphodiesterase class II)